MEWSRKKLDVFYTVHLTDGNKNIANELFCLNKNPSATAFNNSLSRPASRSNWHYILSLPGKEDTEGCLQVTLAPLAFQPRSFRSVPGSLTLFSRYWAVLSVCVCVSVCWWGSECGNWELFSANLHRIHFVCTIRWLVWRIFYAFMAVSLLESDQDAYWTLLLINQITLDKS